MYADIDMIINLTMDTARAVLQVHVPQVTTFCLWATFSYKHKRWAPRISWLRSFGPQRCFVKLILSWNLACFSVVCISKVWLLDQEFQKQFWKLYSTGMYRL